MRGAAYGYWLECATSEDSTRAPTISQSASSPLPILCVKCAGTKIQSLFYGTKKQYNNSIYLTDAADTQRPGPLSLTQSGSQARASNLEGLACCRVSSEEIQFDLSLGPSLESI